MPTLPIYNSKQNIKANTAEPLRNEAAQSFKDDQMLLKTGMEITQKWSQANDVMQETEAKAKHGLAVADIQSRAAADPDFKNSEKYYTELAKAKEESMKLISNQQIASQASLELDYNNEIASIRIRDDFQKKQLLFNKEMVKVDLNSAVQKKLMAITEAQSQQEDIFINNLLNKHVQAGTISHEEASALLKDAQETVVKYEVYNDNSTQEKDSALLKELRKADGKYSFLDPDTRLKMIEESQRRIFQNNQTFKREAETSRDGRFTDVFTKANEGTLTLNDLDAEMSVPEEAGGIPKKQLLDIRKALQSRIKTDLQTIVDNNDKAFQYAEFVDTFISDETDRQKGREAIVNAFKDGILSPKEASFLNKLKRETEGIQQIKSREQFMSAEGWKPFTPVKNAINAVNDFFTGKKNFTESEKALAIKRLLSNSADGGDPAELSQTIIKESVINKNPEILGFNPDGQVVVDENGYIKMMNNKGDSWNIEEAFKKAKESK